MSRFEIVRMPQNAERMSELLEEFAPFMDAMYTEVDEELYGKLNFLLDHWLFLWDNDTGFFLTERNKSGDLLLLAMLTKYRDIWHGRERLEVHRISMAQVEGLNEGEKTEEMVDYLVSVAPLMGFDFIYLNTRGEGGDEKKSLVWIKNDAH